MQQPRDAAVSEVQAVLLSWSVAYRQGEQMRELGRTQSKSFRRLCGSYHFRNDLAGLVLHPRQASFRG